ncbi:MAG: Co2+/Mg2+ efflux protein ApaG [Bacteroidetes bacterium]|nr:Co2+/Mg2+ efflux protein ApaG [Bacteroidota bacterium]
MEILTTNGITVSVETQYLAAHSDPRNAKFIFGYFITIENGCPFTVQLMRRHWTIFDACGVVREVDGPGVIGQQPIMQPGERYAYSSYCDLTAEIGKMHGAYEMTRIDNKTSFEVAIPEFRMVAPFRLN